MRLAATLKRGRASPCAVGNVLASTDGQDKVTGYAYDGANRLKTVTNPAQETTTYAYDGAGRRTGLLGTYTIIALFCTGSAIGGILRPGRRA